MPRSRRSTLSSSDDIGVINIPSKDSLLGKKKVQIQDSSDSDSEDKSTRKDRLNNIRRRFSNSAGILKKQTSPKKQKFHSQEAPSLKRKKSSLTLTSPRIFHSSLPDTKTKPQLKKSSSDLESRYDEHRIIKLQTVFRSWIVRNHILNYSFNNDSVRSSIFTAINEIFERETSYLAILKAIVKSYLQPLQSNKLLSLEVMFSLFSNFETLYHYHRSVHSAMKRGIESWPYTTFFTTLSKHVNTLNVWYNDFAENLEKAEETYDKNCNSTITKLFFLNKAKNHSNETGMSSFKKLISYPSIYLNEYRDLCLKLLYTLLPFKKTKVYHGLYNATASIIALTNVVRKNIRQLDTKNVMELLSKRLVKKKAADLVKPSRFFIRQGNADWGNHKKVSLFLFSDILLVTKPSGKKFTFIEEIPLENITMSSIEFSISYPLCFYRLSHPNGSYNLSERSNSGFSTILLQILPSGAAASLVKKDCENNPSVSPVIFKTIYYLDKCRLKTNLFRSLQMREAGERFLKEELTGKVNDFNKCHRDELGWVFLSYIRFMPDEKLISSDTLLKYTPKSLYLLKDEEENQIIETLSKVIQSLDKDKRCFIDYLSYFLSRLYSTYGVPSEEMSINIAPFLIRDTTSTAMIASKHIVTITRYIQVLIENREKIFQSFQFKPSKLPETVFDFFTADSFDEWWQLFRSNDRNFISHITKPEFLLKYFEILSNSKRFEEEYSVICKTVLSTDAVIFQIFSKNGMLDEFFKFMISSKDNEYALFYYCDVFVAFSSTDPKHISDYLLKNNVVHQQILEMISRGNMPQCFKDIIEIGSNSTSLHPLIIYWCKELLKLVMDESIDEFKLCISCEILSSIFKYESFLFGKTGNEIKDIIKTKVKDILDICLVKSPNTRSTELLGLVLNIICKNEDDDDDIPVFVDIIADVTDKIELNIDSSESSFDEKDDEDSSVMETHLDFVPSISRGMSEALNRKHEDKEISEVQLLFIDYLMKKKDLIRDLMLSKTDDNNLPKYLGRSRYQIIQIVCSILLLDIPQLDKQLMESKWIDTISEIYFYYERNSILHLLIQNLVEGLSERNDTTLLCYYLQETDFLEKSGVILKQKSKPLHISNLKQKLSTFYTNPEGKKIMDSSPHGKLFQKQLR